MAKASESLIAPLHEALKISEKEHEEARAVRDQAAERERDTRGELQKIRAALQRFDPDYKPPDDPKKAKGQRRGGSNNISPERLRTTFEAMQGLSQKDGFFTQSGVRTKAKLSPAQSSVAFNLLRDEGIIRKGGKVEGSSAEKWALMDEGAFDRFIEKLEESANG